MPGHGLHVVAVSHGIVERFCSVQMCNGEERERYNPLPEIKRCRTPHGGRPPGTPSTCNERIPDEWTALVITVPPPSGKYDQLSVLPPTVTTDLNVRSTAMVGTAPHPWSRQYHSGSISGTKTGVVRWLCKFHVQGRSATKCAPVEADCSAVLSYNLAAFCNASL